MCYIVNMKLSVRYEATTVLLTPFAHVAAMPALTVKTVTQFYKPRK
jgi:hypothetical protein